MQDWDGVGKLVLDAEWRQLQSMPLAIPTGRTPSGRLPEVL